MDNLRLFLWAAFLALAWLVYTTWTSEHAPPLAPAPPTTTTPPATAADEAQTVPPLDAPPPSPQPTSTATEAAPQPVKLVHVQTDVLDAWIDLRGGDLVRVD